MRIYDAKVNHLTNPLGFKMPRTVFSWKVEESEGKRQEWARIRVAADEQMREILYDGGEDTAADSLGTRVALPLAPYTRYYWTVAVRTDAGEEATSGVQWFETAKREDGWQAKWITCDNEEKRHPLFSRRITRAAGKTVSRARLYLCGLGLYEAYYNGKRIGNEYFAPGSNDYQEWVQYQTYDVTGELAQDGTLSVLLGNGWYKGRFGYQSKPDPDLKQGYYGNEWKLIAELRIEYEDGTLDVIGTDESWSVTRSKLTFSNLYDGEWRDDTLPELAAEQAVPAEAPAGRLTERMSLPVTAHERLTPVALLQTPAGEQVYDLGQEITGIFSLRVHEPAGTLIHIRTGEILQQGSFYNANLRTAKSEYYYVSDGREQVLVPYFTFFGYRYVKVEGVGDLKTEDFEGIVLHSDFEPTGQAQTAHPLVNRLIQNVRWGMKGNFLDVPTDCPQRDERMGWTGDANVFSPTATYLADTYAFYNKYLYDMGQEQKSLGGMVPNVIPSFGMDGTACVWGDACTMIPWNLYLFYGDKSILEDQFESMKAWVDYIRGVDGDNHGWRDVFHFGDWLALDHPALTAEFTLGGTDEGFIANVYYAVSAEIVSKAAALLGKDKETKEYAALSREQFAAVKEEYYSATGRCCVKTQTALLLTLKYHLSDNTDLTIRQLKELFEYSKGKLRTGFVGTPLLCNVLTEYGMGDLAMRLLLNEEYPGWLYEVKLGATTVWERWNSLLEDGTISGISMNSMNHYAYGSILEWFLRHVAGLDLRQEVPGSRLARIAPLLSWELRSVSAVYDSPAGRYESAWELTDPRHVTIRIRVPLGCKAQLLLPLAPESVYENRDNPVFARVEDGVCLLDAGTYEVSYELTQSLQRSYSLDTPIRELLSDQEMADRLEAVVPLSSVPAQYQGNSISEVLKLFGRELDEQTLRQLEMLLQG